MLYLEFSLSNKGGGRYLSVVIFLCLYYFFWEGGGDFYGEMVT